MPNGTRGENGGYKVSPEMAALKEKIRDMRINEDISAGIIAERLGLTRNAVIGHLTRMKLGPLKPARVSKVGTGCLHGKTKPKPPPAPPPVLADVVPLGVGILALGDRMCRYAYGDREITFCGHAVAGRGSFCPGHAAIAFQKPHAAHGAKTGLSGQSWQKQQFGGR
jgi:hypothetical protein